VAESSDKTYKTRIGDTVLMRLNHDPLVLRPLVVTDIVGPGEVSGQLLYGGVDDRHTDWARGCKTPPAPDVMAAWVVGVHHGNVVGCWRHKDED
jgi:hypothetical protein